MKQHPGQCSVCGCTDRYGCDGGCGWANAEHTLCTRCIERIVEFAALRIWAQAHPTATTQIARAIERIAA